MPELPEVETVARNLREKIQGRKLTRVRLCRSSVIKGDADSLRKKTTGLTVRCVRRRGKYIGLESAGDAGLWFHLGMTGQLLWADGVEESDKHLHFAAEFSGLKEILTYRDIRRFGKIFYADHAHEGPPGFRKLGPEPLEMSAETFIETFRKRNAPVKSALLNQTITAGIGNIYADESLFRAGIHPRRRASKLTREKLGRLFESMQSVLKAAVEHGGSTIDDFLHADGLKGGFQRFHKVYGRFGKPCLDCSEMIKKVTLGGRTSSFCPRCQQ